MANWVRLWDDMPDDPKWRLIARKSGASEAEVIAVFVRMMTLAGRSEDRGSIAGWDDEVEAAALGVDEETVAKIREHMEGRVIEGGRLRGWEKRQPSREDNSSDRVRAFRERKQSMKRSETHCNAPEADTEADTESTLSQQQQEEAVERETTRVAPIAAVAALDGAAVATLERRLRDAAGLENSPDPDLIVVGPIVALIGEGFDLDRDILPVIRAKSVAMRAAGKRPPRTWRFFIDPIREAREVTARSTAPPRRPVEEPMFGGQTLAERMAVAAAMEAERLGRAPQETH